MTVVSPEKMPPNSKNGKAGRNGRAARRSPDVSPRDRLADRPALTPRPHRDQHEQRQRQHECRNEPGQEQRHDRQVHQRSQHHHRQARWHENAHRRCRRDDADRFRSRVAGAPHGGHEQRADRRHIGGRRSRDSREQDLRDDRDHRQAAADAPTIAIAKSTVRSEMPPASISVPATMNSGIASSTNESTPPRILIGRMIRLTPPMPRR